MAHIRGACVFCRGPGLTKEHLFPRWARSLLDGEENHIVSRLNISGNESLTDVFISPKVIERQGFIFNKRLRVVCRKCNGSWMSAVEQSVKDVLTKMIIGEKVHIDEDKQQLVALWAAMRACIYERDDPSTAAITSEEYEYIYRHQKPPENWKVFICSNNASEWQTRLLHSGSKLWVRGLPYPTQMNTQKTMIGMKNVMLVVLSSTAGQDAFIVDLTPPLKSLQIFPYKLDVELPLTEANSNEEFDQYGYKTF